MKKIIMFMILGTIVLAETKPVLPKANKLPKTIVVIKNTCDFYGCDTK